MKVLMRMAKHGRSKGNTYLGEGRKMVHNSIDWNDLAFMEDAIVETELDSLELRLNSE